MGFKTFLQYYRWLRRQWNYRPTTAYTSAAMRFSRSTAELKYAYAQVNWRKH